MKTTPSGKIRHPLMFVGLRKDKKTIVLNGMNNSGRRISAPS
jgi:hypothetical protein